MNLFSVLAIISSALCKPGRTESQSHPRNVMLQTWSEALQNHKEIYTTAYTSILLKVLTENSK